MRATHILAKDLNLVLTDLPIVILHNNTPCSIACGAASHFLIIIFARLLIHSVALV